MDTLARSLGAGRVYRVQAVGQDRAQDPNHLAVAIRHPAKLALHAPHRRRQFAVLERSPVPQRARLSGEHRHAMQRVADVLAATEGTGVLADNLAVLPDLDALGVRTNLDSPADGPGVDRGSVVIEPHEAGP